MAKTKISQFDAVASNNTDINSVNVAEGCPPSGINNAIREMASLLKKQEVGTDAMTSPDIDGGTIDGATIGGSSGVTIGVSDGTVSAPSIKFTSDTNTGIYRGGTDILKFVTAGTDAVTITASQQVGIGASSIGGVGTPKAFIKQSTTSFYEGLLVSANANDNVISVGHTGTEAVIGSTYGTSGSFTPITFKTSNNDRLNIASNGDISFYEDTGSSPKFLWDSSLEMAVIGDLNTTAYGGGLVVATPTGSHITVADSVSGERLHLAGSGGSTTVGSKSNHDLQFITNDTLAVTIDTSQNLLVGKTSYGSVTGTGGQIGAGGVAIFTSSNDAPLYLNRTSTDGDIVEFYKDGTTVGSIGNAGARLFINSGNVGLNFAGDGSNQILPSNAGVNRDDAITLGTTNVRFKDLYLSGGVYLGGTASANLLDSYEEGTWSPTISFGTATFAGTYYVKIGTQVTVWANVNDITATTGNDITIGNLPFTSRTQAGNVGSVLWRYFARTSAIDMISYITSNSTNIQFFWCFNNDGDYDKVTYADGSGSQDMDMIITITYQTS
jgi:hypothetical protein